MDTQSDNKARKSLWGYGIAAVYTTFALVTLGVVAFTMTQKVDLVAPDYYAKEVAYEQQINRLRQTNALEQQVTCALTEDGKFIKLQFPVRNAAVHGTIMFYRPSESALDEEYEIDPDDDGSQLLPTAKRAKGLWRIKVTWTAEGREFYNEFIVRL